MVLKLQKSSRSREYYKYDDVTKAKIVFSYLSEGLSHRRLDEKVLGLDYEKCRGFEAMNILHFLGIRDRDEFEGMSANEIITTLENYENSEEYGTIISLLKLITENNTSELEEIYLNQNIFHPVKEGRQTVYYSTKYERSSSNRKQAIQLHGTKCMACGFDFEKSYGDLGRGYIEVHHLKPLSSLEEEVVVNPETDLIVLCSNCHRMIHRKKNSVLSLTELKNIIQNSKTED